MSTDRIGVGLGDSLAASKRWLAAAVLLTGNFVTILDLFIVNVALETLRQDLGATLAQLQLVMVGYSAAYAILLINGARLGDLYGRRRMFLVGMALFTVASLLCGLAYTPLQLIGARILQGAGAAVLMPQVFASLRVLFAGEERRRAFGIMAAVQGVASIVSQLTGGLLIAQDIGIAGWRLIFLINVPIGAAALIAGRALIVDTRAPLIPRFDFQGAALGALGLALLLVPFMQGREYGWPWWSFAAMLAALPVLYLFTRHEAQLSRRGGTPIIELALFRNGAFAAGVTAVFFFYSTISSFFFSLTMLLQSGLHLSPLLAGAVFTPAAVAFFAGALLAPRIAGVFGHRAVLIGVLVFAVGLVLSIAAGFGAEGMPLLITSLIFNGFGQGMVIPLALNFILSSVDEAQAGMASGMVGTMQTVGTTVGVAIVGVLLFSMLGSDVGANVAAASYPHAFASATIYNLVAVLMSAGLFLRAGRRQAERS